MFSRSAQCTETETPKNPFMCPASRLSENKASILWCIRSGTLCFWQHEEGHEETHEETTESLKTSAVGSVMNHEHLKCDYY